MKIRQKLVALFAKTLYGNMAMKALAKIGVIIKIVVFYSNPCLQGRVRTVYGTVH
jgi:hypothetical protein